MNGKPVITMARDLRQEVSPVPGEVESFQADPASSCIKNFRFDKFFSTVWNSNEMKPKTKYIKCCSVVYAWQINWDKTITSRNTFIGQSYEFLPEHNSIQIMFMIELLIGFKAFSLATWLMITTNEIPTTEKTGSLMVLVITIRVKKCAEKNTKVGSGEGSCCG